MVVMIVIQWSEPMMITAPQPGSNNQSDIDALFVKLLRCYLISRAYTQYIQKQPHAIPFLYCIKQKLETVSIANALQLEAGRRRAVPIRFNTSHVASSKSLSLSAAVLERIYCLYVTLRCDLEL